MTFKQRENSGSLFRNEKKEQEKHPDHTGAALIGGVEYRISAWIREGSSGKKFFSLAFTPRNKAPAAGNTGGGNAPF